MEKNALLNLYDGISMTNKLNAKFEVKIHSKIFNPKILNFVFFLIFLIFRKTKYPEKSKTQTSFLTILQECTMAWGGAVPECTCGIHVWVKETLVVYLIRIWQPSQFLCSLPLIRCHFYLLLPYQLTSAMLFLLWHITDKRQILSRCHCLSY